MFVVSLSCLWLFVIPVDCSTPGFPVLHHLPELAQTHVHWIGNVIQPSYPLLSPSPSAFYLFQHQGFFQWVSSLNQVAKVLELQLQHLSLTHFIFILKNDLYYNVLNHYIFFIIVYSIILIQINFTTQIYFILFLIFYYELYFKHTNID